MTKITIVEDNYELSLIMKENLENMGFDCEIIKDFKNIENEIYQNCPNLILLDINLPYNDGYYLCRKLRKTSDIPIIIVSAKDKEMEQVMGIELGADDYITKPFSFEILAAKIKAVLRRVYGTEKETSNEFYTIGKLLLNENTFKLTYKDKFVELTKNEFRLLKKLMQNKNKIVTRETLIQDLWDSGAFVDDNNLSVNITRVKNKLGIIGLKEIIKTKRSVGYMLDSNVIEGEQDE
ncbi:response regulator transcription factor [Clostridium neuense]|uniref:Stage 0 sporulation protein A homolog n=1 Tax=Clostridium neuense TaxID=1728934 RepID=A0ABW8TL06_9CLOT